MASLAASSRGRTPPQGLLGWLTMIAFVAGVRTSSIAAARTVKASSHFVRAKTGVPPASFTCSGNDTQYGATTTTSSPGLTSVIIAEKRTDLAPGPTSTSVGLISMPWRLE